MIEDILPGPWTDFSGGITRQNFEYVLQSGRGVTIYMDNKPVAVMLPTEEYQLLMKELEGAS